MLGNDAEDRYIDREELCSIGKFSRATSYNYERDDSTFPKQHKVGPKSVRFHLPEVRAWLAAGRQESPVDLGSEKSDENALSKPRKQKRAGRHPEESDSGSQGTQLVASSDASPAVPARVSTGLTKKISGVSLDVQAEAGENVVDVPSSEVLDDVVVTPDLASLPTPDKQLSSELDADKCSAIVAEVPSLFAENTFANDESDTASVVTANLDNVLKKILPIVNSIYFRPEQRSAYLKDLIEDVAKGGKWVSFRELAIKFELKIENADDLWLRGLIKELSEQSFKERGVHLSVLVGDDTVYRRNPTYYPGPEFLALMDADNLDKNKALALAWREMTKVHQAYQAKQDI